MKEKKKETNKALKKAPKKDLKKEQKKEPTYTLKTICSGLDASGKGIVKIKNDKVLIENLLPQEEVELEYTIKKEPKVISAMRLSESADRVKPRCRIFDRCGGCQLQHLNYKAQLEWKKEKVQSLLGRYGQVQEILGMEEPWAYRNKVIATFSLNKKGKVIAGIYEEDSHQVVPYSECWIQDAMAAKILNTLCELMTKFRIEPYDEDKRTGLVRHCLIRIGHVSREVLVCLVCASSIFPARKQLVQQLRSQHPEITTIVMNVNNRSTSIVLGQQERVLSGMGKIQDQLCGLRFSITAKSFYQINTQQTEILYYKAMELANLTGQERVLDAYCGIGTISLVAAQKAKEVVGVEVNPVSIKNAIENARVNHIRNAWFVEADAGLFMEQAAREGQRYDVVFMDPPRSGADERFLKSLCQLSPDRIVYISCNPSTQARDLRHLTHEGYQVEVIVPVDLFPMTVHVETVVMLSHKKLDSVINVKVEFGEGEGKVSLDNIAKRAEAYKPKERVTYKMIKEYIEAKYGFKVHTAHIAEVKRDLGLPMYDTPNAVEELKQPSKHPTPEKVEAIKDALKHFEEI